MARKIVFKGIEVENIPSLSMEAFLKLIPSTSRRTLKRMGTQIKKFIEKLRKHDFTKKPMKTHFRQAVILPEMLGKRFLVYNGKDYVDILILPEMLGHKLGEYSHTIKIVRHSGPGIGATRGSKSVELK
ncbi:MAG TPA: ribosomal protein S19 family protein [Candidatus Norongarragalinales archaeon]|nr:ribosomal protein S19 family protein [Candidatus Norongarragalinales archaeon]